MKECSDGHAEDLVLCVLVRVQKKLLELVQGEPVFMKVWGVGLCLMAAHILVYWALVSAHKNSKRSVVKKVA